MHRLTFVQFKGLPGMFINTAQITTIVAITGKECRVTMADGQSFTLHLSADEVADTVTNPEE